MHNITQDRNGVPLLSILHGPMLKEEGCRFIVMSGTPLSCRSVGVMHSGFCSVSEQRRFMVECAYFQPQN
jgi:hypothetical protein